MPAREPAQDWTCRTRFPWHRPATFGLWDDLVDLLDRGRPHIASPWHRDLVLGYRLAVADQQARAEAATHGYATELARYYGEDGAGDGVETRLTFRDWLVANAEAQHYADELDPDALPEGWDQGWDELDTTEHHEQAA